MRRYNLALVLILFSALTLSQVSGAELPRLPDFHVVSELPSNMVAGSTYQTSFTFVKPNHKEAELNITVEITEEQTIIGFAEFHIEGTLDTWTAHPPSHETVEMDFTETSGGVFQHACTMKKVSFNYVTVRVSLAVHLMPGFYTFRVNVYLIY